MSQFSVSDLSLGVFYILPSPFGAFPLHCINNPFEVKDGVSHLF